MQAYTVKLLFHGRPFGTVAVELDYDELEATTSEPIERALAPEVVALFSELGLGTPAPIAVLPLHHQIAQKLHACSEPGSERAHDLVDLQLMAPLADDRLTAATTRRLFPFRRQHPWRAILTPGPTWTSLYTDAAQGLDVLVNLDAAVAWTNQYIARIHDA